VQHCAPIQGQHWTPIDKAAERTVDGLWNTIGCLIDLFPPDEYANYFNAAGYDAT